MVSNCHPFDAGDCSMQRCSNHRLSGRAELELRFPSSQCNQFPFAFHFLCSQVINRGGIFDRYVKLFLGLLFSFKESLATMHLPLIQTRNLFATRYPLPLCLCRTPAQLPTTGWASERRQRPWQKKQHWDKERDVHTER